MTALRLVATWCALLALAIPCPCGAACTLPDVTELVVAQTGQAPSSSEQASSCCPSNDDAADETEETCTHCGDGGHYVAPTTPELPDAAWVQVVPAPGAVHHVSARTATTASLFVADPARGPPAHASPPPDTTPIFLRYQVIRC